MAEGCFWGFVNPDKDTRPWYERGFFEIKPVAAYANQSEANERTPEYQIKKDGSDPKEGYPDRQGMSPDADKGKGTP